MPHCESTTKKGNLCPILADRLYQGKWVCHIHDPAGTFRQQHPERRTLTTQPVVTAKPPETPAEPAIDRTGEECPFTPALIDF